MQNAYFSQGTARTKIETCDALGEWQKQLGYGYDCSAQPLCNHGDDRLQVVNLDPFLDGNGRIA